MTLELLTSEEQTILHRCMLNILQENHIEDPEFRTRLGINRDELRNILADWPNLDDQDHNSDMYLAINNCLNEMCHGISVTDTYVQKHVGVSCGELTNIYRRWRILSGAGFTGIL